MMTYVLLIKIIVLFMIVFDVTEIQNNQRFNFLLHLNSANEIVVTCQKLIYRLSFLRRVEYVKTVNRSNTKL